jgi:hypothetical protein
MAKRRPTSKRGNFPQVAVAQTEVGPQFLFRIFVTVLLLSVYGFYLAHQFNLTVGDLGRHLKNGQLFLETGSIPKINLYSYAYPDYPFINHHWGTGVVFYVIERLVGFSGLSVAFIGISMVTFLIFINLAAKYSSFAIAAPIAVVVLPILITRDEVRPELFSYLLAGMFLQVLWGYKYGKLGFRWLLCLPIFEIFWVNLHIYFFIGIFLVAAYLFESLVVFLFGKNQQNVRDQVKALAVILLLTIFATCLNPAGISGAIYPFLILNEYGVPVIENYSVAGILRAGYNFLPLIYFVIILVLVSVSWVYALVRNRSSLSLGNFLSSAFFFAMAWSAIRNFAFFAYFALPLAAVNLKNVLGEENKSRSPSILRISAALAGIAFFLIIINPAYFVSSNRGRVGIGLEEANDAAAEFLLKEKIQGPIFNNFDVAGYLVYHLYPDQRVFVDNRPEAYPVDFFTDVYFPMQSDEEKWAAISQHYGFNVIVFNYRERSVRGEQFIIRRVLDPLWAPVYFDKNIIILAKRDGPNQPVVTKYELPKDRVLERSNG